MSTIKNTPYLNTQYNRILSENPNYKIKFTDAMPKEGWDGVTWVHEGVKNPSNLNTEIFRGAFKSPEYLKYTILHEFGHTWSAITGFRAYNYARYGGKNTGKMHIWIDEIYADYFANHWGNFPLTSDSYMQNMGHINDSSILFNSIVFPKKY